MKTALITGTGMDSKTLAFILLNKGYNVVLTHRRNASQNLDDVKDLLRLAPTQNLSFEFCDITDLSSVRGCISNVLQKFGVIDEFYSLAAMSHVGDSFKNPGYTMIATGVSVFYILDTLKELSPTTKTFQASTSEMFGGDESKNPFNEDSPFELRSPYSIAKNLAYNWCKYYRQTYGMFICSAFTFNHSNSLRHNNFYVKHVTQSAAKISLGKIKELSLGNLSFYRDETYADFACEAMWKMLQLDKPEDFVLGNGVAHSGEEFLDNAFGYFDLDWRKYVKIDSSRFRPNEVVKLVADSRKAQDKLGWIPNRILFKDHIGAMCRYDLELESGKNPAFTTLV